MTGALLATGLCAQSSNSLYGTTAVPFLRIAPDARAAGMGDAGAATAFDANAVHWNLSNLAFAKEKMSLSISYAPWLRALVPDISHSYISMHVKPDSVSAVGISLRYFSLGNATGTGISGAPTQFRPNEFAFDIGYTRRLSAQFSAGITARFIQSNPTGINGIIVRHGGGRACAGDISLSWRGNKSGSNVRYVQPTAGFAITNVGTKMWYQDRDSAEFLPANARIGAAVVLHAATYHQFTVQLQGDQLLVPVTNADAFSPKREKIVLSSGMEYVYRNLFKVRGGYVHDFTSGTYSRYFTTGIGIQYSVFGLDIAYLIPVNDLRNPLENTLRFTLLFCFDRLATSQPPRK